MNINSPTNEELNLALSCCKGEELAQFALFDQYKGSMFGICMRYTNCKEDAEDLLQEGFVQVFKNICQYNGSGSLSGWIRKVFIRCAIQYIKNNYPSFAYSEIEQIPDSFEIDHYSDLETEKAEELIQLLQKLPPGFRTVMNLYILEEKSHIEISKELGISESTSRSQLSRAKTFLKKLISKTLVFI